MTAFMKNALVDPELGLTTDQLLQAGDWDYKWRWFTGLPDPGTDTTAFAYEDADGDSVFTMNFDLVGPAPNWIQYKLMLDGVQEQGSDTQAGGRRRIRFVRKNQDGTYPAEFNMGIDTWNSTMGKALVVETRDGGTVDDDTTGGNVDIKYTDPTIPDAYTLNQNYPNPFNPMTNIEYSIQKAGHVTLTVFNIIGQEITSLVDEHQLAGSYRVMWNIQDSNLGSLPSGIYFYRLQVGNFKDTKRLLLLK